MQKGNAHKEHVETINENNQSADKPTKDDASYSKIESAYQPEIGISQPISDHQSVLNRHCLKHNFSTKKLGENFFNILSTTDACGWDTSRDGRENAYRISAVCGSKIKQSTMGEFQAIASCYDGVSADDILFCTTNTHKVCMDSLLCAGLQSNDFIFAHTAGQAKEVILTKTEKYVVHLGCLRFQLILLNCQKISACLNTS